MANYLLCKIIQPSGFLSHMQDNFPALGAPMSQPNDPVATILQQWRRERPDLDVTPMGPVGRLRRRAVQVQKRLHTAFARHQLASWEFDLLATLRRSGEPYRLAPTVLFSSLMLTSGAITR